MTDSLKTEYLIKVKKFLKTNAVTFRTEVLPTEFLILRKELLKI